MARHVAGCEQRQQQFTPTAKQSALFHAGSSAYEDASRTVATTERGTVVVLVVALLVVVESFVVTDWEDLYDF